MLRFSLLVINSEFKNGFSKTIFELCREVFVKKLLHN